METGEGEFPDRLTLIEMVKSSVYARGEGAFAHRQNDPAWLNVRPPLEALSEAEAARLAGVYDGIVAEGVCANPRGEVSSTRPSKRSG